MRHLWSFLAGVAAAPLTWMLIALGQDGAGDTIGVWMEGGSYNTAKLIEPTVYLAVAGILLGLLGTLRVSPLGPLVAGILLAGPYVGYFIDPFAVHDAVPSDWGLFGDPMPLLLPLENGTLFLIGMLLLMATFSLQRWRRWPAAVPVPPPPAEAQPTADDEPTLADLVPSGSPESDPDATSPTLGYPRPMPPPPPPPPAPRREGESPWSAPPRAASRRDDATN